MNCANKKWSRRAHAYRLLLKQNAHAAAAFRRRFTKLGKLDRAIAKELAS